VLEKTMLAMFCHKKCQPASDCAHKLQFLTAAKASFSEPPVWFSFSNPIVNKAAKKWSAACGNTTISRWGLIFEVIFTDLNVGIIVVGHMRSSNVKQLDQSFSVQDHSFCEFAKDWALHLFLMCLMCPESVTTFTSDAPSTVQNGLLLNLLLSIESLFPQDNIPPKLFNCKATLTAAMVNNELSRPGVMSLLRLVTVYTTVAQLANGTEVVHDPEWLKVSMDSFKSFSLATVKSVLGSAGHVVRNDE
jgi:hypothetical protein